MDKLYAVIWQFQVKYVPFRNKMLTEQQNKYIKCNNIHLHVLLLQHNQFTSISRDDLWLHHCSNMYGTSSPLPVVIQIVALLCLYWSIMKHVMQETIYIPPCQLCSSLKCAMDHMEAVAAHTHPHRYIFWISLFREVFVKFSVGWWPVYRHLNHVGLVQWSKSFEKTFQQVQCSGMS